MMKSKTTAADQPDENGYVLPEKVRVQFEVPRHRFEQLEELMIKAGIETKKELIDSALSLFECAIEEICDGNVLGILDAENKFHKLRFVAFTKVNKTHEKCIQRRVGSEWSDTTTETQTVGNDSADAESAESGFKQHLQHPLPEDSNRG
jgi:hypothetical protein